MPERRNKSKVGVLMRIIALIWTTVLLVVPLSAQVTGSGEPVLMVQGRGEVRIEPDLATVRLGILEQSPTAQEAQESVNIVANGILAAVLEIGVEERQVQTARLVLSPVYSRSGRGSGEAPRIVAYRASNTVSVRVEELDSVGAVIDAALGAGANQLEGVSFGLVDDLAARADALRNAINEAQTKAAAMADALGVRLDAILSVTEGGVAVQPQTQIMGMARAIALQEAPGTPVSPGEVSVSASVSIRYRISQD